MADVSVSVGEFQLRREEQGLTLEVFSNEGSKLGCLTVSKGGLRWLGANQREAGGQHFAAWETLVEFMGTLPRTG